MSNFTKQIAFIGGGNMAEAVIAGLIQKGTIPADEILVTEANADRRDYLQTKYHLSVSALNSDAPQLARSVFLAVKPKIVYEIQNELKPHLTDKHLIISILAGQSREKLGEALGHIDRVIRVMPNLPAQVGKGVSAISFPPDLYENDKEFVRAVLRSTGEIVEVDEPLQDVVTAVSGSGPGYIFMLAEHFIAGAILQGLDEQTARMLVTETLAGAAEVLKQRDDHPNELVRKVATPGGTTEAGLSAMNDFKLPDMMREVVRRAAMRSVELNKS